MLLNHAPLIVAEQFGTLETRYARCIDPGLGALRKLTYSRPVRCDGPWKPTLLHLRMNFDIIPKMWKGGRAVRAIPGAGLQVPLSILGSSLFGAAVSAMLGLPFAFASR